eukprot:CAMPEP_0119319988 /NCGR_PEP_ID=MMETSP1333-20130426/51082_1 /TAXON_ID=418940 /ORGANISM="Scyphosphaera apsteinii, Strain RCC1455" /LENGTH=382 /DNA_ID=CAMNT_0007326571 /DNA_START=23 /DNA_END=1171 /DNA_ORIENTATION=+
MNLSSLRLLTIMIIIEQNFAFSPEPWLSYEPYGCENGDDNGKRCGNEVCKRNEHCDTHFKPRNAPGPDYGCYPCGMISGRPFVVNGSARLPKTVARESWSAKIKAEQIKMPSGVLEHDTRMKIGLHWVGVGSAEWASVASFSKHSLELLALGAPAHLLTKVHTAAIDEVRHAELTYALASSYLGVNVGPDKLDNSVASSTLMIQRTLAEVTVATAREGCVTETMSAVEARLALAVCAAPEVCQALAVISEDEKRHAALAWREVDWALQLDASIAPLVKIEFERQIASLSTTTESVDEISEPFDEITVAHGLLSHRFRTLARTLTVRDVLRPALAALLAGPVGTAEWIEDLLDVAFSSAAFWGGERMALSSGEAARALNGTCA